MTFVKYIGLQHSKNSRLSLIPNMFGCAAYIKLKEMHVVNILLKHFHILPPLLFLTRQSLCRVLTRALYVSWSMVRPSGTSFRKSRSLKVGFDFSLSFLDARLLYVEPFKSNLRCMRTERGKILFMTTTRMFLPPHWTQ